MHFTIRPALAPLIAMLALFLLALPAAAQNNFKMSYCSSQNTASNDVKVWDWQSNGYCKDQCESQGTFAYAVIKWKDCYCSNYAPQKQLDTSECQEDCPGYPDEKCGNDEKGYYAYIDLGNSPSGTQGGSKPTSANVSPSSSATPPPPSSKEAPSSSVINTPSPAPSPPESAPVPDPETVIKTVTESVSVSTDAPDSPDTSLTHKPPASSTLQTSAVPDPQTSTRIITQSGIVITETIVTAPTGASQNLTEGKKGGSNNTGAIVGGVVGGVALLAIIVGAVIFFLWRRRRQQRDQDPDGYSGVQRNTSTMSKAGLLGRSEKQPSVNYPQYPPAIAPINTRQSRNLDSESISPISASDRRSSRPIIFDQRLNPSAIMVLDNTSRGSIASLDDSQDYGRQLKIRNPDSQPERW